MRPIKFRFRIWDKEEKTMNNLIYMNFEKHSESESDDDYFVVMQYTGLTDRNGIPIYEGDICSDDSGNVAPIEWVQEHCQFLWMYEGDVQEIGEWCVVVGNVWEHPHLLES